MASHVALLRGINVGGRNKVPMAELREMVASLGHTGVTTYIQSGNVLFSTGDEDTGDEDTGKLAAALEAAIADRFGISCAVVVLTRDELARVLDGNPHAGEPNPKLVHVVFLNAELPADVLDRVAAAQRAAQAKGARDTATAVGQALFVHTPDGYGKSEFGQALLRIVGPALGGTARNWATATKLLTLCDAQ